MWQEWWAWLPAWLGLVSGGYGAWRAWATDRRLRAREGNWTVTAIDEVQVLVQSRLPYRALDVVVETEEGTHDVREIEDREPVTVDRRGAIKLVLVDVYVRSHEKLTIRWRHNWRQHREEVLVPVVERTAFRDQRRNR